MGPRQSLPTAGCGATSCPRHGSLAEAACRPAVLALSSSNTGRPMRRRLGKCPLRGNHGLEQLVAGLLELRGRLLRQCHAGSYMVRNRPSISSVSSDAAASCAACRRDRRALPARSNCTAPSGSAHCRPHGALSVLADQCWRTVDQDVVVFLGDGGNRSLQRGIASFSLVSRSGMLTISISAPASSRFAGIR